jgi:hypothetical protein
MKNLAALLAPRPAAEQKSHQTDEICTRPKPRAGTERGTKPDRRKRRRSLTRNSKTEMAPMRERESMPGNEEGKTKRKTRACGSSLVTRPSNVRDGEILCEVRSGQARTQRTLLASSKIKRRDPTAHKKMLNPIFFIEIRQNSYNHGGISPLFDYWKQKSSS